MGTRVWAAASPSGRAMRYTTRPIERGEDREERVVVGSGNVFADLGHLRPAEALAKAELARKISAMIARRGLTQAAAAEVLEIDQPKVSALKRGRLAGFSLDRLVRFLVLLGSDVKIVVKPASGTGRRARVMVA